MELIQVTNSVSPRLIGLNVKGQSHITIVTVHRHPSIENYDADRTARMIEKMEEMFEEIKFLHDNRDFRKIFSAVNNIFMDLIDFIEHGDKEEIPTPEESRAIESIYSVIDDYHKDLVKLEEGDDVTSPIKKSNKKLTSIIRELRSK